jgi:hypothetical protein
MPLLIELQRLSLIINSFDLLRVSMGIWLKSL